MLRVCQQGAVWVCLTNGFSAKGKTLNKGRKLGRFTPSLWSGSSSLGEGEPVLEPQSGS